MDSEKILKEIRTLQRKMNRMIGEKGLNHPEVYAVSVKIDKLHNIYQALINDEKRHRDSD